MLFRPQEVQLDCASFHYYSGLSAADQDLHWANGCCFACGGHGHRAGACKGVRQPAHLLCELHADVGHWRGAVALEKGDPWSEEEIRAAGWEVGGEEGQEKGEAVWWAGSEENGPWRCSPTEEWSTAGQCSPVEEEWWGKKEEEEVELTWLEPLGSFEDLPALVAEEEGK
jgi:hypothetical protein